MNSQGPIIVIEDDVEDHEIFQAAYQNLNYPNEVLFFLSGEEVLEYLNSNIEVTPFIIISDINMPKLDGFELRDKIRMDAKLQNRCVPYLFLTTASSKKAVFEAYSLSVQGFFVKKSTLPEFEKTLNVIMEYWNNCVSPNNFR